MSSIFSPAPRFAGEGNKGNGRMTVNIEREDAALQAAKSILQALLAPLTATVKNEMIETLLAVMER